MTRGWTNVSAQALRFAQVARVAGEAFAVTEMNGAEENPRRVWVFGGVAGAIIGLASIGVLTIGL